MLKNFCRFINRHCCTLYLQIRKKKYNLLHSEPNNKELVIISMTSWKKRIGNVAAVIDSIIKNTVKPDKIVLNLSLLEFPNKEQDLPGNLQSYINNNTIEIIWSERNDKAFKKFIPTMNKYPNAAIICIDDDFIYPKDLIETFINKHKEFPNNPLSGNRELVFGTKAHCGCASLIKRKFFGYYLNELIDENVINIGTSDVFYSICAVMNLSEYKYVGKDYFINMKPNNQAYALSSGWSVDKIALMHNYLTKKVHNTYHLNIEYLNNIIFVNPLK